MRHPGRKWILRPDARSQATGSKLGHRSFSHMMCTHPPSTLPCAVTKERSGAAHPGSVPKQEHCLHIRASLRALLTFAGATSVYSLSAQCRRNGSASAGEQGECGADATHHTGTHRQLSRRIAAAHSLGCLIDVMHASFCLCVHFSAAAAVSSVRRWLPCAITLCRCSLVCLLAPCVSRATTSTRPMHGRGLLHPAPLPTRTAAYAASATWAT